MAIKINGQDLLKRFINGQEIVRVYKNGGQIRPDNTSTILDFVNDANTGAYWYDTLRHNHGYVAGEGYYFTAFGNDGGRLVLPSNIQGVGTLSNVHLWFYTPGNYCGMGLSGYRNNFANEDIIRYPENGNRVLDFYKDRNLVESINMTSADVGESEMDINFDYVNGRIYGNINGLNYTTSQLTQQYVDNWQDSWEHGGLAIHFSIWGDGSGINKTLYIRKVSITTI